MRMTSWMVLGLMLLSAPAYSGQVYKWVDAAGHVHYSDQPHPGAKPIGPQTVVVPAAKETVVAGEKLAPNLADCEKKKKDLDHYRTAAKIVERDALNREREFTQDERQQLVELTQRQVDQLCAQTVQKNSQ